MRMSIHCKAIENANEVIAYIDHRASFAFSNWYQALDSLTITLTDINGPRNGVDQQCRVVAVPEGMAAIIVTERRADIRAAIDRALSRASQSVARKLKRRQGRLRQGGFCQSVEAATEFDAEQWPDVV